jgi:broad specificity phosphatase PhoE
LILYVARHGETDWNREGRYQGRRESSLTQTGVAQAHALADALAMHAIGRVISSPLRRCVETALPIAELRRLDVEQDDRLVEIAHGDWEGRLRSEIEQNDAATMQRWRAHPELVQFRSGESLADVYQRWRGFTASLHGDADVAIITHDVLVRLAILDAAKRPLSELWIPRVVNGGYAVLGLENGGTALLDECVDAHLQGLLVDTGAQAL